jgi:hypothetical protein
MNLQPSDPVGLRLEPVETDDPDEDVSGAEFDGAVSQPPSFFCIPEYRRQLIISILFMVTGLALVIFSFFNFAWGYTTRGLGAALLGVLITLPGGTSYYHVSCHTRLRGFVGRHFCWCL